MPQVSGHPQGTAISAGKNVLCWLCLLAARLGVCHYLCLDHAVRWVFAMLERFKDRALLLVAGIVAALFSWCYHRFMGEFSSIPYWALLALSVYDSGKRMNKVLARKLMALPLVGFLATASLFLVGSHLGETGKFIAHSTGLLCLAGFYFYVKKHAN